MHKGPRPARYQSLMSTYRLKNLLAPHSVALVGASPRHGSVGRAILNNICKAQFKGEFGLVNPRYHEIDGVASVGSIAKLAFAPELVVLTAPARTIPGLIDEAGSHGAAGAVIVSAGLGHGPGSLAEDSGEGRAKIRHAADRPELPGHHDAGRQSQCELFRAYAGGGKSGADLAVRRHCRGHGGLGGTAGRWLFRHCLDRRPARCRYRRSARLLRAGRKDPGYPALHRGDQGRPQVHVGGACRRPDQAGRGRQVRPDGARRPGGGNPYRRAGRG